jgi:Polysaccharide pyruvyl transferase
MIPEIEGLDLFVLGGGGILYDRDAREYMREVFIVNELNVPVILYAISADPLTREAARRAVRDALNVSPPPVITVRDRLGYRLLEDVGVTPEIHLTADPAFLLDPHPIHSGCKTKPCLGEQHCPKTQTKTFESGPPHGRRRHPESPGRAPALRCRPWPNRVFLPGDLG